MPFRGRSVSLIRSLAADQRGNTAIIFGLAIVPLVALGGGAVDFSRRADVRVEMQNAADSAAIAAARVLQSGEMTRDEDREALEDRAEAAARALFNAALANSSVDGEISPDVRFADGRVAVSASTSIDTAFLTVIGMDELPATVTSEVDLPPPILVEIAMVLDYSKSMEDDDKYLRMTDAATTFVNRAARDRGDRTQIGIVPFSEYVYADMRGSHIRDTSPVDANLTMSACLLNRDYPYAATDEAPFPAVPASRWQQADPASAGCQAYDAGNLKVRDLSDDFRGVAEALAGMRPTGLTNIALATEIGFHMLSPEQPFDQARPFSDANLEKVMIVLTDGVQTVSAFGPGGETSTVAADAVTAEVCDNAAAAGIEVFTIAYDIRDERVRSLLADCATGVDNYFEPDDAADIAAVFDAIYSQIAESVWVSR